jgi:archaellum biogenesis ATPase FlaH
MLELTILRELTRDEGYYRKVLPFLKEEYFGDRETKIVFGMISEYLQKYDSKPTKGAMEIVLDSRKNIDPETVRQCKETLALVFSDEKPPSMDWLVEQTEKFCKDKALYNAILESIHIIDGKSKDKDVGSLPKMLSDALAVSFDANIGHDYIEDCGKRYEFYHRTENRIPFDIEQFNTITGGGVPRKSLNILMAGPGVGKSMFLCHFAASCMTQNLNVLYITCEMSEERIAERIDANLMDIPMEDLRKLPADIYAKKMGKIRKQYTGRLIVKEYPTSTANANHFRALLNDLKTKKGFVPDVIFVDYLNICASARIKMGASVNSYTYVKAIAEEIRALAMEFDVPIFSATQVNRIGFNSTDVGLENTSESFGLPATADLMLALIATEQLEEQGQIMVKQLKNRYNDISRNRKFTVGIDRSRMKILDVGSAVVGDEGFGKKGEDPVKPKFSKDRDSDGSDRYSDWSFD